MPQVQLLESAAAPPEGFAVTMDQAEQYLESCRRKGLSDSSVTSYRRKLNLLYDRLPEDKRMERETLRRLSDQMLAEGYGAQTVNVFLSAANGFLAFSGHRELQYLDYHQQPVSVQPELTRTEYLRLLSAAKLLGEERRYLLIKTIVLLGLNLPELVGLTVETVERGYVTQADERRKIPDCLREELLRYADRQGILHGCLFVTGEGKPLSRTYFTTSIQALSRDAQVDEGKCNPRCLRKLYQSTRAGIQANLAVLGEQMHERMLEQEQLTTGWT